MNHFIISYRVFIDDSLKLKGITGNVVAGARHSRDYRPLELAERLREQYRLQYPQAGEVRVQFGHVQAVNEVIYQLASEAFTMPLNNYELCW